jgi:hypothetical protein
MLILIVTIFHELMHHLTKSVFSRQLTPPGTGYGLIRKNFSRVLSVRSGTRERQLKWRRFGASYLIIEELLEICVSHVFNLVLEFTDIDL